MNRSSFRAGLRRNALCAALALGFAGTVGAQTNTAGAIAGHAASGDTITATNPATGFTRTLTVGADGNYRFSSLPTGQYTVTRNGGSPRTVTVNVGTASNVDYVATGSGGAIDTVTVVGGGQINPIDVTSVESTTILTAEQVAKLPVPRDVTSVALLAPGTVKGDAAFGNLASFGGSSVAENNYFVNGFNITNSFRNLNFAQLPFEAIAEQQVKTGGYGAEFGRSTGGVVNIITKRGTNDFHAGGSVYWTPQSLSETNPDLYYNPDSTGGGWRWREDNSRDNGWKATAAVWAGGALVKDRLFAYGLLQFAREANDVFPATPDGVTPAFGFISNRHIAQRSPLWLLKLDWQISDAHLLEFTGFSDQRKTSSDYYATGFGTAANPTATPTRLQPVGSSEQEVGGKNYVLKYTGYLTDNLTLSSLYGESTFKRAIYLIGTDGQKQQYTGDLYAPVPGCPVIVDSRSQALKNTTGTYVGCNFLGANLGRPDSQDQRKQFRVDLEWQLGSHLLRGGIDTEKFTSVDGSAAEGGVQYTYFNSGTTNYVRRQIFRNGANVGINMKALYLEDSWHITDNFMTYLGLRWDTFENLNGAGQKYVEIKNQFSPRLGFSWDVNGDGTFKVFGNAGRYALPLTSGMAVRGTSASRYVRQDFFYTGIDPVTRAPIGLTPCTSGCPTTYRQETFINNEFGVTKDPKVIASQNLKPMYQDEYMLGFQRQLTDHVSMGVRAIHRDLKAIIDDQCDQRAIVDWGLANGFTLKAGTGSNLARASIRPDQKSAPTDMAFVNPGITACHLYNPGSDGVFYADVNGDGTLELVTIPADKMGVKGKRKYTALELFWQGNWDRFFLQGSYTFGRSIGNSEGGPKSDIGQATPNQTQDFDYPELAIGSFGYLPNDRRHSLKLFGNYEISDEWSVGGKWIAQSGRPVNCLGVYGNDPTGYSNSYFSCDPGEPPAGSKDNGSTVVPRGSAGRLPWTSTFDVNVAWKPAFLDKRLTLKMDVFNLLNSRRKTSVLERGEDANGNPRNVMNSYLTPTSWQSPRSVQFMAQYEF